jgi:hypothetical protein
MAAAAVELVLLVKAVVVLVDILVLAGLLVLQVVVVVLVAVATTVLLMAMHLVVEQGLLVKVLLAQLQMRVRGVGAVLVEKKAGAEKILVQVLEIGKEVVDCMAVVLEVLETTQLMVKVLIKAAAVVFVLFGVRVDSFHQPVQEICNGIL